MLDFEKLSADERVLIIPWTRALDQAKLGQFAQLDRMLTLCPETQLPLEEKAKVTADPLQFLSYKLNLFLCWNNSQDFHQVIQGKTVYFHIVDYWLNNLINAPSLSLLPVFFKWGYLPQMQEKRHLFSNRMWYIALAFAGTPETHQEITCQDASYSPSYIFSSVFEEFLKPGKEMRKYAIYETWESRANLFYFRPCLAWETTFATFVQNVEPYIFTSILHYLDLSSIQILLKRFTQLEFHETELRILIDYMHQNPGVQDTLLPYLERVLSETKARPALLSLFSIPNLEKYPYLLSLALPEDQVQQFLGLLNVRDTQILRTNLLARAQQVNLPLHDILAKTD